MATAASASWTRAAVAGLVWHFFLLVPTLAFRQAYVATIWYRDAPESATVGIGDLADLPLRLMSAVRLAQGDVLVLAALVAALWLLGVRLLRLDPARLAAGTVIVVALAGGANWLCLAETGRLLTPELASIAWHWALENPGVVLEFHPYRVAALLLAAVVWAALLAWAVRRTLGRPQPPRPLAVVAGISALLLAAAIVPARADRIEAPDAELVRRGFWVGALAALRPSDPVAVLGPTTPAAIAAKLGEATGSSGPPAGADASPLVALPLEARRPRHIVLVVLETAPWRYYRLGEDPSLPTFAAMSRRAIVAERHYATRPFSIESMYSLLAGVYPSLTTPVEETPDLRTDALGVVLGERGYETTYVDAYKLDWRGGTTQRRLLTGTLGFSRVVEVARERATVHEDPFRQEVARERTAFRAALAGIDSAEAHGRKGLVVVASALGHFDWPAAPEHRDLPAERKLHEIGRVLDGLMAGLLEGLAERGLADSTLVVVTGDHGLRYGAEFASLGEPRRQAEASFRVPFLLYAPGLLDEPVRVPWVTSHVDIAPTLLALTGVPTERLVMHGRNVLDPTIAGRTVFLLNGRLTPYDYVWHGGTLHELDHITGRHPPEVETSFAALRELADLTTGLFLQRAAAPDSAARRAAAAGRGR